MIKEKTLGRHHPSYATTLNNMAFCYSSKGEYDRALSLHEQCRMIEEKTLGKQHPDYATTLNGMAGCYKSKGEYDRALGLYEDCRTILLQIDPKSPLLAQVEDSLKVILEKRKVTP